MKRNSEMNKAYKKILKDLDEMFGEADAGLFLSIILTALKKLIGDKEQQNLRTIEIKVNDYFSVKWDFDKNDFVE